MMSYAEQVRYFKHLVPIGRKSVPELIEVLKSKVDVEEIPPSSLLSNGLARHTYNALYSLNNMTRQVQPADMVFRAFRVVQNERGRAYFPDHPVGDDIPDVWYYVIFEEQTGYIASGSNQLFFELELAQGVSQEEFDSEGMEFRSLLAHIAMHHCR